MKKLIYLLLVVVIAVCSMSMLACGKKDENKPETPQETPHEHTLDANNNCTGCDYHKAFTEAEIFAKFPVAVEGLNKLTKFTASAKTNNVQGEETMLHEGLTTYDGVNLSATKTNIAYKLLDEQGQPNVVSNLQYSYTKQEDDKLVKVNLLKDELLNQFVISSKEYTTQKIINKRMLESLDMEGMSSIKSVDALKSMFIEGVKEYVGHMLPNTELKEENIDFTSQIKDENGKFSIYGVASPKAEWIASAQETLEAQIFKSFKLELNFVFTAQLLESYETKMEMVTLEQGKEINASQIISMTFSNDFNQELYNEAVAKSANLTYDGEISYPYVDVKLYVNGVDYPINGQGQANTKANEIFDSYIMQLEFEKNGETSDYEITYWLDADYTVPYVPTSDVIIDIEKGATLYAKVTPNNDINN